MNDMNDMNDINDWKTQHQIEQAANTLSYYAGYIAGHFYRSDEPFDITIHITDPNELPVIEYTTKMLATIKSRD